MELLHKKNLYQLEIQSFILIAYGGHSEESVPTTPQVLFKWEIKLSDNCCFLIFLIYFPILVIFLLSLLLISFYFLFLFTLASFYYLSFTYLENKIGF